MIFNCNRYMPDPNLPILRASPAAISKAKLEMIELGVADIPSATQATEFGWEGIRRRLENLLGITDASDTKGVEALRKDLEILMLLDAGKTVGWDGSVASGAVTFFEAVTGSNSAVASGSTSYTRDPKIVLNW